MTDSSLAGSLQAVRILLAGFFAAIITVAEVFSPMLRLISVNSVVFPYFLVPPIFFFFFFLNPSLLSFRARPYVRLYICVHYS